MELPPHFFNGRKLDTLVENKTTYAVERAELHIFETHQTAEKILLQFNQSVVASMIKGKKVMHLRNHRSFNFMPGESLILPANETMCIDFPEAQMQNPTRCSALVVSDEKINQVVDFMNTTMPKVDSQEWTFMNYNFHFNNNAGFFQIIQRLFYLFMEDHPAKDTFVDLMLQELIMRILRADSKKSLSHKAENLEHSGRLSEIVSFIIDNLDKPISVAELSKKAYMSESNFHRVFKNELGCSPIDFINDERIRLATSLLKNPKMKIKEVYMRCGFDSRSYFNRMFKQKKNISPSEFQNTLLKKAM